jgi:hypothetical protein
MTRDKALALVMDICPQHLGLLWNTTDHDGCDTSWAISDQYGDDTVEIDDARRDLGMLASGIKPTEWEAHNSTTLAALTNGSSSRFRDSSQPR